MKSITLAAGLWLASILCSARGPVDSAEEVAIGGIHQFITIQGRDSSLPLLLFLHGGPGGSVIDYADRFTHQLQEHFVVVQWDQRETGRTLARNASPVPLTLSLFEDDTYELIRYLLDRFNREKLYLAAHSWGTALGFSIVRNHPEVLYAYMPIGPMIRQLESERVALQLMKDRALASGDTRQYEELSGVRIPFETGNQLYTHRKWLLAYSKSQRALSREEVNRWALTWLAVYNEACRSDLIQSLPSIRCPIYFFVGRRDLQTNGVIAERYFQGLQAPRKAFFWFEHSAHGVPTSEPARLQALIIETVLAETFTDDKKLR